MMTSRMAGKSVMAGRSWIAGRIMASLLRTRALRQLDRISLQDIGSSLIIY